MFYYSYSMLRLAYECKSSLGVLSAEEVHEAFLVWQELGRRCGIWVDVPLQGDKATYPASD